MIKHEIKGGHYTFDEFLVKLESITDSDGILRNLHMSDCTIIDIPEDLQVWKQGTRYKKIPWFPLYSGKGFNIFFGIETRGSVITGCSFESKKNELE